MIIRHKRFMDVCFEIVTQNSGGEFTGYWWNMGYKNSWVIEYGTLSEIIWSEWEKLADPDIKCYRYGKWVSL